MKLENIEILHRTVTLQEAAKLEGVSFMTMTRRAKKLPTHTIASLKQQGKSVTLIYVRDLSTKAHKKLFAALSRGITPNMPAPETVEKQTEWYGNLATKNRQTVDRQLEAVTEYKDALRTLPRRDSKTGFTDEFCADKGISTSTFYRWLKRYEAGVVALGSKNFGQSRTKLTPEMRDYIIGLIAASPDRKLARIYEYFVNKFGNVVGRDTIARFAKKWKAENGQVYEAVANFDGWKNKYMAAFGNSSAKATHYTQYYEVDGTPADILCADGKRYNITGCIDVFSRKLKLHVSKTSNSDAVAAILRMAILDWGIPEFVIRDNGKDYVSKRISAALAALSVSTPFVPHFTPEAKPHIERVFRTMSHSVLEELAGSIGHSVADRKRVESRKGFASRFMKKGETVELRVTPEQLQTILNDWVNNVYHHTTHSSLETTPELKAASSTVPLYKVENEHALDILLSEVGEATVQKKGIRFQNGYYIAPELIDFIKERVEVRQDQKSAGVLHVFTMEGKFICTAYDSALANYTPVEFAQMKKDQRRTIREAVIALQKLADATGDPYYERQVAIAKQTRIGTIHPSTIADDESLKEAGKAVDGRAGLKPSQTLAECMRDGHDCEDDEGNDLSWVANISG